MADNSKIAWCDATFNPWIGCAAVSPACDHCYAERWGARFGVQWGNHPRRRTSAANWREPLKWNRAAKTTGIRKRVFCASLADVFDNQVPSEWRADLWALIAECDGLDWLLLTKRPQNISRMLPDQWGGKGWPNVWLGTTAENQQEADRRIPLLLEIPATRHFVSIEPLLGPLDLGWALSPNPLDIAVGFLKRGHFSPGLEALRPLDWVIVGGESGSGARPMHPAWLRSLRDQCQGAGVPFFFKQWGEWIDADEYASRLAGSGRIYLKGREIVVGHHSLTYDEAAAFAVLVEARYEHQSDGTTLIRVGKNGAGRLLDERTWDEFPRG